MTTFSVSTAKSQEEAEQMVARRLGVDGLTFVRESDIVEIYGPADERGSMEYLGRIDTYDMTVILEPQ
jgi:hypothetical protein